jgi:hypothetical protein
MTTVYELTAQQIKEIATQFFFDWYNAPGTDTLQGFDAWWEVNNDKYGFPIRKEAEESGGIAGSTPPVRPSERKKEVII